MVIPINMNRYSTIIAILLTIYMSPAMSEYFIGVDYSRYNIHFKSDTVDAGFYEAQQRIRLGYRGDFAGFQIDFLTEQDDTNASGYLNFKSGPAVGAYLYLYDRWGYNIWGYGKLGVLMTDSTLKNNISGVSNDHALAQFSGAIGLQFELTKHVYINADYTYSYGEGEYRDILGGDDPSIRTHALAAGLTFAF